MKFLHMQQTPVKRADKRLSLMRPQLFLRLQSLCLLFLAVQSLSVLEVQSLSCYGCDNCQKNFRNNDVVTCPENTNACVGFTEWEANGMCDIIRISTFNERRAYLPDLLKYMLKAVTQRFEHSSTIRPMPISQEVPSFAIEFYFQLTRTGGVVKLCSLVLFMFSKVLHGC